MATALQSVNFMKIEYDKDKALRWLKGNHYPDLHKLQNKGSYWSYEVRPKSMFVSRTERFNTVGGIKFVYGSYRITPSGKKKDGQQQIKSKQRKSEAEVLAKALKPFVHLPQKTEDIRPMGRTLEEATPLAGSGVQSVRVPKSWGKQKARQWVDNKGWTADYYGKSPFTETDKWYRFRQNAPKKKGNYKIKTLPNKVQLVID